MEYLLLGCSFFFFIYYFAEAHGSMQKRTGTFQSSTSSHVTLRLCASGPIVAVLCVLLPTSVS